MALFGRDEKDSKSDRPQAAPNPVEVKLPPTPPPPPPRKEPVMAEQRHESSEGGQANAHLGKGSKVSGKLSFDGMVQVDGQVEGEIAAQDTLVIGESAVVTAQISGATVIIRGKVTGDINARTRVEIRAPGKLFGNIVTPSLVIHEGVVFEGHCSMGGGEQRVADRKIAAFRSEEKGATA